MELVKSVWKKNKVGKGYQSSLGGEDIILIRLVSGGLPEKVAFELRPKIKRLGHGDTE